MSNTTITDIDVIIFQLILQYIMEVQNYYNSSCDYNFQQTCNLNQFKLDQET